MSVDRVPAKQWARERSGYSLDVLSGRFPKLEAWERGEVQPTFRQFKAFAHATYAPIGYFSLPEPPAEPMPIPDFRAVASVRSAAPRSRSTRYGLSVPMSTELVPRLCAGGR